MYFPEKLTSFHSYDLKRSHFIIAFSVPIRKYQSFGISNNSLVLRLYLHVVIKNVWVIFQPCIKRKKIFSIMKQDFNMVFMTIWHETIYFIISQNNNLGVKYASFDFQNAMKVSKRA